jgi:HPr kinase/phosphorylase
VSGANHPLARTGQELESNRVQIHGTTIALNVGALNTEPDSGDQRGGEAWVAALIRGPSGSGKSDLALRCLAQPMPAWFPRSAQLSGARLVADDRTDLTVTAAATGLVVSATPPASIAGLLEVRGLGILTVPYMADARLVLLVDLAPGATVPRYPAATTGPVGSHPNVAHLPQIRIAAFESSSSLKLLLALVRTAISGSPVGADAAKHHCLPEGQ